MNVRHACSGLCCVKECVCAHVNVGKALLAGSPDRDTERGGSWRHMEGSLAVEPACTVAHSSSSNSLFGAKPKTCGGMDPAEQNHISDLTVPEQQAGVERDDRPAARRLEFPSEDLQTSWSGAEIKDGHCMSSTCVSAPEEQPAACRPRHRSERFTKTDIIYSSMNPVSFAPSPCLPSAPTPSHPLLYKLEALMAWCLTQTLKTKTETELPKIVFTAALTRVQLRPSSNLLCMQRPKRFGSHTPNEYNQFKGQQRKKLNQWNEPNAAAANSAQSSDGRSQPSVAHVEVSPRVLRRFPRIQRVKSGFRSPDKKKKKQQRQQQRAVHSPKTFQQQQQRISQIHMQSRPPRTLPADHH
ncbi:hypothetical protein FQA47_007960 [Oryzias melastigma]|uniref:Uncharacterized protein n=1 Tax=Oryzias melastigma TaxID=30732 RepID=A0A834BVN3_ORYME|nr:hypothetical protein FQA47_007960 [Oryzias melastigma]